ncbi:hypothetical protein CZ771_00480 [Actinomycetales bacterium JB111]|nr:hypothetical protein CZ771_00480 [Actinomycetales bacterium JB111]
MFTRTPSAGSTARMARSKAIMTQDTRRWGHHRPILECDHRSARRSLGS